MLFIVGISIAIFLSLLLLIKKNKSRADKILVLWLILISINQIFNYLNFKEVTYKYPNWLGIDFGIPIIIGVFLYFYVREITGNPLNRIPKIVLHLLPTIFIYLLAIPFYKLQGTEKVYIFKNNGLGYEWFVIINNWVIAISGLAYSIWSIILIKKHQKSIQDNFSNTDKKELQWLRLLSFGFVIIWLFSAFFDNDIIFSIVVVFVLCIAIFGINQLNIFNSNSGLEGIKIAEERTNNINNKGKIDSKQPIAKVGKYAKSGLNEADATKIYANLTRMMQDNVAYKDENLTLVELSKRLEVHPNHLSQVINEKEGKNFYNYVNSLRIKEFIKLASLPENKKYTMISLAYDCGFSTKSTFNKHFKLHTGKTPTEFFSNSSI
ncbi:AraC family transcriptional regulator [Flavivirga sp. 57AJ16]|uniref:helix-turn-helix domain-containing protein n=1 Tax=Flavivirga sp. 57AJ16 TaxID=3025307 RepID=UPI00236699DC|nr:helix-turn-helix domain-containing protein [Flavivirga sp. 57AJ16]MDD7887267.1 helix-turn-helix domain-containing protein [Flavivirga sp. 57AJ16]